MIMKFGLGKSYNRLKTFTGWTVEWCGLNPVTGRQNRLTEAAWAMLCGATLNKRLMESMSFKEEESSGCFSRTFLVQSSQHLKQNF